MNYTALITWLGSEPTSGWPASSNEDIAAFCNEAVIDRDRTHIPVRDVWGVILANRAEWAAMSEGDQAIVTNTLAFNEQEGVPTTVGTVERTTLVAILGTVTKQQLAALIPESVSRVAAQPAVGAQTVSDDDIGEAKRRAGV